MYVEVNHNQAVDEFDDDGQIKSRNWSIIPERLLEGVVLTNVNQNGVNVVVAKVGMFISDSIHFNNSFIHFTGKIFFLHIL